MTSDHLPEENKGQSIILQESTLFRAEVSSEEENPEANFLTFNAFSRNSRHPSDDEDENVDLTDDELPADMK